MLKCAFAHLIRRAPRAARRPLLALAVLGCLSTGCFAEFPSGRLFDSGAPASADATSTDAAPADPRDRGPIDPPLDAGPLDVRPPDGGAPDAVGPVDAAADGSTPECVPRDELCDGVDQDCDGAIDEGVTERCPVQDGVCAATEVSCVGGVFPPCDYAELVGRAWAADELGICDGLDNDCDGAADEDCDCEPGAEQACGGAPIGRCRPGVQRCVDGLWGPCNGAVGPIAETCNAIDDDCDGDLDERLAPMACETGRPGACGVGDTACVDGAQICQPRVEPVVELCNGVDDDCDAALDEGLGGDNCAADGVGRCAAGRTACVEGFIRCEASPPAVEQCNGLDDDCDGAADEALDGQPCEVVAGRACLPGVLSCVGGVGTCTPQREQLRDGVDEDCDGRIDEFPPELDVFDLTDAAVGGLGVRPGKPPGFAFAHPGGLAADTFVPQPDNPFVDGVFIPSRDGDSVVDTDGDTYDTASRVGDGNFWRPHAKGPGIVITEPVLVDYRDRANHSLLELHANYGITFDLAAIAAHTGRPVLRFQGRAGISQDGRRWAFAVLVDGDRADRDRHRDLREQEIDVDVEGAARLTLICTDGDSDFNWRHTYFGDPELTLGPRP